MLKILSTSNVKLFLNNPILTTRDNQHHIVRVYGDQTITFSTSTTKMALDIAPTQATPPTGISPDNSLSSIGRTLLMVGLLTIFTLAITAIVKVVSGFVSKRLRQLFHGTADPEATLIADPVEIPEAEQPSDPEEIDGELQPVEPEEIHEEALTNFSLSSLAIE